jgi:hypothetical protein
MTKDQKEFLLKLNILLREYNVTLATCRDTDGISIIMGGEEFACPMELPTEFESPVKGHL